MPELPPIPPIMRWREHLKLMRNQYYNVDGNDVRLINYVLYDDNQVARVFFNVRNFDIPYDEMPERMRHWIPVTDNEFMTTYDHISAESNLKPSDDSNAVIASNVSVTKPSEPTPNEVLTTMFIEQMPKDLLDIGEIVRFAQNAIMNLKDPKTGVNGQAYLNQAHAIAVLLDRMIKAKKVSIDQYNLAMKMLGHQAPKEPPTGQK